MTAPNPHPPAEHPSAPAWRARLLGIYELARAEASLHPGTWIERELTGSDFYLLCGRRRTTGQHAVRVRALRCDTLEWVSFELEALAIARVLGVDHWPRTEKRRWFGHELQFLQPSAEAVPMAKGTDA